MTSILPLKAAIYYSYLSSVNGLFNNASAAAVFSAYDILVLGDGLEAPSHPDYANTVAILGNSLMANTKVFGYINSTLPLSQIQTSIDQWAALDNLKGVFLDQFGFDFGTTREKQNEIIWCVHNKIVNGVGLQAMVNSWNPADSFDPAVNTSFNPLGLATRLGSNDWYLLESFAIINGNYDDANTNNLSGRDFQDKANKANGYKTTFGTKLIATTTADTNSDFSQNMADYSYCISTVNGFDAWAWGEYNFSASSASLPFRTRTAITGTAFTNALTDVSNVLKRNTNVGIDIDLVAHTVSTIVN